MRDFLLTSLIGSIVLTLLLNVVPRLFPGATRRAEENVHRRMEDAWAGREPGDGGPRVKVFFPWKAMIVISIVLTVVVNLVGALAG